MSNPFKIVIPMAGLGSRMRPHTWTRPKPLLPLAGKTVLDYSLEQFKSLPHLDEAEYVFIISTNQANQIQEYMQIVHPEKKVHFVLQQEMRGQSHALWLARHLLTGPMLMAFSDTMIETDLGFLSSETSDGVAWVKPMEDPRRFGVIKTNSEGWATRLVEKPQDLSNNMVVVGFYYFRDGSALIKAIEEQMRRGTSLKGEFFLADAINILIENGAKICKKQIDVWLDAGIPAAMLETNRYLLDHVSNSTQLPASAALHEGVVIIPPVSIADDVVLRSVVIGPHVSLGKGCKLENVVIRNSIVDSGSSLQDMTVEGSLIGRNVTLAGKPAVVNLGDNSQVSM